MGKKLLVSLAMEGKFSNEGLQGIEDDDDVLTAMARELVTEKGVGESAAAVWKAVQEQHARLLPASSVLNEELKEELVAGAFNEVVTVDGTATVLVFGARPEKESPPRTNLGPRREPIDSISQFAIIALARSGPSGWLDDRLHRWRLKNWCRGMGFRAQKGTA